MNKAWNKISAVGLIGLSSFVAGNVKALPLPDTSNCSSTGHCLKITNTSSTGQALAFYGVGNTAILGQGAYVGVYGTGTATTGVFGTSTSGAGVTGHSVNSDGVYGYTGHVDHSGVAGFNTGNAGIGVYGNVFSGGTGSAIYGDAGGSGTAWAGDFDGRVRASQYVTTSDARLKVDVRNSSYGIQELAKLRPVTYKWRDGTADQRTQLGLIAQEVQKTLPELVDADANSGMLSVNYQGLVPVVVRALQEQQALIKKQQQEIAALQRARPPALSSNMSMLALALLPFGVVAAWRRRGAHSTR